VIAKEEDRFAAKVRDLGSCAEVAGCGVPMPTADRGLPLAGCPVKAVPG